MVKIPQGTQLEETLTVCMSAEDSTPSQEQRVDQYKFHSDFLSGQLAKANPLGEQIGAFASDFHFKELTANLKSSYIGSDSSGTDPC